MLCKIRETYFEQTHQYKWHCCLAFSTGATCQIFCNAALRNKYEKEYNLPMIFQIGSYNLHNTNHYVLKDSILGKYDYFMSWLLLFTLSESKFVICHPWSGSWGNFQKEFKCEGWKNFKNDMGVAIKVGGCIFDVGVDYFEAAIDDLRHSQRSKQAIKYW